MKHPAWSQTHTSRAPWFPCHCNTHTSKLINSCRLLPSTACGNETEGPTGLLSWSTYRHAKERKSTGCHLLCMRNQKEGIPDVRQQRVHVIQNYGCDVDEAEGCCCPDDQRCWQEAEALLEPPHDLWMPPTGRSSLLTPFSLVSIFLYLCYLNQLSWQQETGFTLSVSVCRYLCKKSAAIIGFSYPLLISHKNAVFNNNNNNNKILHDSVFAFMQTLIYQAKLIYTILVILKDSSFFNWLLQKHWFFLNVFCDA